MKSSHLTAWSNNSPPIVQTDVMTDTEPPGTPSSEAVGSTWLKGLNVMLTNTYSSLAHLAFYAEVGKFPFSCFLIALH